jgi:sugar phosphate isomerase/epimerase
MTASVPDLLASYFTLAGDVYPLGPSEVSPIPFRRRVEAAAKTGWKGVGLIHADVKATAEKMGLSEMRKIVEGAGIRHLEIEFLSNWYLDGELRAASDITRREMFAMAEAVGIRRIKVAPGLGNDPSPPVEFGSAGTSVRLEHAQAAGFSGFDPLTIFELIDCKEGQAGARSGRYL